MFSIVSRLSSPKKHATLQIATSCALCMSLIACGNGTAGDKSIELITEKAQWPAIQNEEKTLEMQLSAQQWLPIGFGTPLTVGKEKRWLSMDLVALRLTLEVKNLSGKPIRLHPSCVITGLQGIGQLYAIVDEGPAEGGIEVQPSASTSITLQSRGAALGKYASELSLSCSASSGSWGWELRPLPPHNALFGGNFHCLHEATVKLIKQKWTGMAGGSHEKADGSGDIHLTADTAGLELILEVGNPTTSELGWSFNPQLIDKNGGEVSTFFDSKSGRGPDGIGDVLILPAGSTTEVALEMPLQHYDDLLNRSPLSIRDEWLGINERAIPLPTKTELFSQ